jgi:hypothetical protein
MTTCVEVLHDIRNRMLRETAECLLKVAQQLDDPDPNLDLDIRLLLETAQHAAGRVNRNEQARSAG